MRYSLVNHNKNYKSIYGEIASQIYLEKKSRFVSYLFAINNVLDATDAINRVTKDNKDASHVVYFYSITQNGNVSVKYDEDGEPSGSAIKAIYHMIEKEELTNICVVIVRFFGGILLGAGPLSRAYLTSFKYAYEICSKEMIYEYVTYSTSMHYASFQEIESKLSHLVDKKIVVIQEINFSDIVEITLQIRKVNFDEVVTLLKR